MRMQTLATAIFLILATIVSGSASSQTIEKPIVIVIPSYNNKQWLEKNLDSVLAQNYSNYRVIYVDDSSRDSTGDFVEEYFSQNNLDFQVIFFDDSLNTLEQAVDRFASQVNNDPHKFTLVRNIHRCGAMANLYRAIHSCRGEEIIATLDGDDWFYHEGVLSLLNDVYSSGEVWFTHGTLKEYPWGHVAWSEPLKPEIIAGNAFREVKCPSHLRTFYTWLFKKIPLEDFLYEGNFYPMTWDMAIMFPLAEMAGERHAFISEVTYVYNMANSINDNKVDPWLQNHLDKIIRNKPRYQRLEKADIPCK